MINQTRVNRAIGALLLVVETLCDPVRLLEGYNRAVAERRENQPRWSDALLARLTMQPGS
jgi:hypothetical protein